jgi:endo-1,4-beta-xylanase
MISRRRLLSAAAASPLLAGGFRAVAAEPVPPPGAARPPLKDLAAAKGILYGSCAAAPQLLSPDDFTELLVRECALVVPENEMKWADMMGPGESSDYRLGDKMIDFVTGHGMLFRAHTMLWYWRTPGWFTEIADRGLAEKKMLERVNDMGTRYKGRVYSWDVVNEPLKPDDGRPDALRQSVFLEKVGPQYLDLAYRAARAADPHAKLVVNEYDIEYDTPEQDTKRLALLKLIERMKKDGTPVDAVGVQAHLSVDRLPFSAKKLRTLLADLAAFGVELQVTELDCTDERAPADIKERDRMVADEYRRFLDVALDETAVKVLVTWGVSDRHSWIVRHETNNMKWRTDAEPSRPLPFDAALQPKPAWTAIVQALDHAPKRGAA